MGGVDKGLQIFKGKTLASHTIERLQLGEGTGPIFINANRNLEIYKELGFTVVSDPLSDFAGPLAGFLAGLNQCSTPWMLTVPCDTPNFPLDISQRLMQAAVTSSSEIAMVSAREEDNLGNEQWRPQPVFCLMQTRLLSSLVAFTAQGGRKIDAWTNQHKTVLVPFDKDGEAQAFFNANTLEELKSIDSPTKYEIS